MSHSMSEARFLESSDSVRFKSRREAQLRKRHLEIEILLSLLFGDRIGSTGPYSFDSSGFLEIAAELARNTIGSTLLAGTPILLGLMSEHNSFLDFVASQVNRSPEEFVLSGWPSLSPHADRRSEFTRRLTSSHPHSAEDLLERVFEQKRVEDLLELNRYFTPSRITRALPARIDLIQYVDEVVALPLSHLAPETRDRVSEIQAGFRIVRGMEVNLRNRSDIRIREHDVMQRLRREVYSAILEFMDTCYNQVLHDSIGTGAGVFSSRILQNNTYAQEGERLAYIVRERLLKRSKYASRPRTPLELNLLPDRSLIPDAAVASQLLRKAKPVDWREIFRLLASPEFQNSLTLLNAALAVKNRSLAETLLVKHIELVTPLVRPYRLVPDATGLKLFLSKEYKFDAATAYARVPATMPLVLIEYLVLTNLNPFLSLISVGSTAIASAIKPVSRDESPAEITGTIETLKRSVRID